MRCVLDPDNAEPEKRFNEEELVQRTGETDETNEVALTSKAWIFRKPPSRNKPSTPVTTDSDPPRGRHNQANGASPASRAQSLTTVAVYVQTHENCPPFVLSSIFVASDARTVAKS